jgi:hypothetical protein
MWHIGSDGRKTIDVPTGYELETGSNDLSCADQSRRRPNYYWSESERLAVALVAGALYFRLRNARHLAEDLAAKLVRFSVQAHRYWMLSHPNPAESHFARDGDFLSGMAIELFGNWWGKGVELIQDHCWRVAPGKQDLEVLSNRIYWAGGTADGFDKHHWRQAQWLCKLGSRTHTIVSSRSVADSYVMEALGRLIFEEPEETSRAFGMAV